MIINIKALECNFSLIQPLLCEYGTPVLAGGAVRDVLVNRTPKDWDFFVLGCNIKTFNIDEFASHFYDCFFWAELLDIDKAKEIQTAKKGKKTEAQGYFEGLVFTTHLDNKKFQFIFREETTVIDLLNTFDWNINQHAYDGSKFYSLGIAPVSDGILKLVNSCHAPLTLERGLRFCNDYSMIMLPSTKKQLELLIEEFNKKNNQFNIVL